MIEHWLSPSITWVVCLSVGKANEKINGRYTNSKIGATKLEKGVTKIIIGWILHLGYCITCGGKCPKASNFSIFFIKSHK